MFCDDPAHPLTAGTPPPQVGPRRLASELYVLCSGLQQSIGAEAARGEGVGTPKLGQFHPKI